MKKESGMNYAPVGEKRAVCKPGEFMFAAIALDHGHINGMCQGLVEAGGQLKWIYDADQSKATQLSQRFPASKDAKTNDDN